MKKFLSILTVFVLLSSLTACGKVYKINSKQNVNTNFTANITADVSGELYACKYERNQGLSKLQMDSPEEISGLTFVKNSQGYTASLEGISLNNRMEDMPALSIIKTLDKVINLIEEKNTSINMLEKEDNIVLNGKSVNYDFKVFVSKNNNFIEKISIINAKMEFMFFNQQSLK